jgi:hypothetical protein
MRGTDGCEAAALVPPFQAKLADIARDVLHALYPAAPAALPGS